MNYTVLFNLEVFERLILEIFIYFFFFYVTCDLNYHSGEN